MCTFAVANKQRIMGKLAFILCFILSVFPADKDENVAMCMWCDAEASPHTVAALWPRYGLRRTARRR